MAEVTPARAGVAHTLSWQRAKWAEVWQRGCDKIRRHYFCLSIWKFEEEYKHGRALAAIPCCRLPFNMAFDAHWWVSQDQF